jgi:hypothetical protein
MDGFLKRPTAPANSPGVTLARANTFPIGYYSNLHADGRPKAQPDLPVIGALAERYTVLDRYFCSLAGETFPNRFYQHAARGARSGQRRGRGLQRRERPVGGAGAVRPARRRSEVVSAVRVAERVRHGGLGAQAAERPGGIDVVIMHPAVKYLGDRGATLATYCARPSPASPGSWRPRRSRSSE